MTRRVALVTGAARGIGLAVCRRLILRGDAVGMLDVDGEQLEIARRELSRECGSAAPIAEAVDVREAGPLGTAIGRVHDRLGTVEILVNSAGVGGPFHRIDEVNDDEWHQVVATNFFGTFAACRAVLPEMKRAGWGRVVNVASVQGLIGAPLSSSYSASKHAVVGLTRSLAAEWGPFGITCNAVCPGYVDTRMGVQEAARPGHECQVLSRIPMGRLATTDEVASAVAYLAGEEAGYVNGACLVVDGAMTAIAKS
jgi:3-oxoacyl-[acyl-carrier protein] reductase